MHILSSISNSCRYYFNRSLIIVSASIMQEVSEPQPNINSVKLEHPAYYCNSYQDQGSVVADRSAPVDAMVVSAAYCEYTLYTGAAPHMQANILFFVVGCTNGWYGRMRKICRRLATNVHMLSGRAPQGKSIKFAYTMHAHYTDMHL